MVDSKNIKSITVLGDKPQPEQPESETPESPDTENMPMGEMMGGASSLKFTSDDIPALPKWKIGKEYPIRLRMIGQKLEGDKTVGEFEIVSK